MANRSRVAIEGAVLSAPAVSPLTFVLKEWGRKRKEAEGSGRKGGRADRQEWADRSAGLIKYSRGERGLPADFCATGGAIVAVLARPTRRSTSESLGVDLRIACVSRLHGGV